MEIRQQIFYNSACYKAQRYINPTGIMVHSTGANNPMLRRYLPGDDDIGYNTNGNHWDDSELEVCVHGFIGKNLAGEVKTYQTLPWNMRAWHAGGTANNDCISFEICEDDLTDHIYFEEAYNAAVDLCVHLCKEWNITPDNIICHSEGYAQGIASNHADVMHWFSRFGATMDDLRADVANELEVNDMATQPSEWAKDACDWAVANGIFKGDETGDMKWQDNVTREQLAVLLKRVVGE